MTGAGSSANPAQLETASPGFACYVTLQATTSAPAGAGWCCRMSVLIVFSVLAAPVGAAAASWCLCFFPYCFMATRVVAVIDFYLLRRKA